MAAHAVLVDEGKIKWVGPQAQAPSISEGQVIDAAGATLLPGLINSHVHLCNDGAPDLFEQVKNDSTPISTLRAARNARFTLECGVTTVRDCGAANSVVIEVAKAIEDKLVVGPRVIAAGRVITMTGGHGHAMGREVDGDASVRHAVRAELHEGAAFIKAMATGGVLTRGVVPSQTALMLDELRAVTREAHNAGRRVASHAIGREGIKNALLAGVNSIEHGYHLDDELLELAVDRGTFLVPTLLAIDGILHGGQVGDTPTWIIEKAAEQAERSRNAFVAAVRSGMSIAAGTDAGTPHNRHTDLPQEMALMVDLGLTPLEAIRAATHDAARNLDLHDHIGAIRDGMRADLILVDGDAAEDISAVGRPLLVAQDGLLIRDDVTGRSRQMATA